jgi:hypothetical protein
MNSIASWSPSQSEPLTVSYMCQSSVLAHVAERGADAALRGDGVRARREDLGQDGDLQTGFGQLDCGTQAGTTGANDHRIKLQNRNTHAYSLQRIAAAHAV